MRLLHVGWGFTPWRGGGLIAYVEDVLAAQAARGHEVSYFFAGRYLPGERPPHLRRWQRGPVAMHELLNSRILPGVDYGSLDPGAELDEPVAEAAFRHVLDVVRPDVVHVQELIGLPSSLLAIPRERGVPVVLAVEDYHLLCPTVKLFDADERNCRRRRPGEMCAVCCRDAPADARRQVRETLRQVVLRTPRADARFDNVAERVRWHPGVARAFASPLVQALRSRLVPVPEPAPEPAAPVALRSAPPAAYDRRREVNAARMGDVDAVLAMSHGVRELCVELGVAPERLRVLHYTLSHIAAIEAAPRVAPRDPMVFTVLNGCASVQKGVNVIVDAVHELDRRGLFGRYRLDVWGLVAWWHREFLDAHPDVALRGHYTRADVPAALEAGDVGIVPSEWEEAYAYTGPEMLAGGLPVIGNARGGIPDYVEEGRTGWLNRSATGAELAERIAALVDAPGEVEALRRGLRERRPEAVKTLATHLDELEAVYAQLAG